MRGEAFELFTTAHGHTGIHITETGLDYLEKYHEGMGQGMVKRPPLELN